MIGSDSTEFELLQPKTIKKLVYDVLRILEGAPVVHRHISPTQASSNTWHAIHWLFLRRKQHAVTVSRTW
jgi:hypothetical protein